jgi:hypothetical protein
VGGDVIINVNNEAYAEDVIVQGKNFTGNYTITFQGILVSQESGTWSANGVKGTGATQGSGTDTGSFAGDSYANKLLLEGGDGDYRIIDSHNDDTLTCLATFTSQPLSGETWEVFDWGTSIQSIVGVGGQKGLNVQDIKITPTSTTDLSDAFCDVTYTRVWIIGSNIRTQQFSKFTAWDCVIENTRLQSFSGGIVYNRTKHLHSANSAGLALLQLQEGGKFRFASGSIFEGSQTASESAGWGIRALIGSQVLHFINASDGYPRVNDFDRAGAIGIEMQSNSVMGTNVALIQFSNNTTDYAPVGASDASYVQ